jgi:hypothetical protein
MKDWSRRHVLRATAGAAIAVPMAALGGGLAGAAQPAAGSLPQSSGPQFSAATASANAGPVMFCIHDAQRGEVSILHGTDEVIVHDRQLVARIIQAANSSASVSQKA